MKNPGAVYPALLLHAGASQSVSRNNPHVNSPLKRFVFEFQRPNITVLPHVYSFIDQMLHPIS